MLKNNLKGLWIPIEILSDDNLSDKEKFIYSLLLFFSTQNGSSTITNNLISELFSISKTQVSKLITSLKNKGYIEVKILRNSFNQVINRTITPIKLFDNTYLTKDTSPIEDFNNTPLVQNFKDNKIYFKNKYIKQSSASNRMETSDEYLALDYNSFYAN